MKQETEKNVWKCPICEFIGKNDRSLACHIAGKVKKTADWAHRSWVRKYHPDIDFRGLSSFKIAEIIGWAVLELQKTNFDQTENINEPSKRPIGFRPPTKRE